MTMTLLWQQSVHFVGEIFNFIWFKVGLALVYTSLVPHAIGLQGLLLLFIADFGCGVWLAYKSKTLSSFGMRRGLAKLLIYILFVAAIALAEHLVIGTTLGCETAIGLLVATELLSIIENLVLLGLPVPYAAKVLALILPDSELTASVDIMRDVVDLLDRRIPSFKDPDLKLCLQTYTQFWYNFLLSLKEEAMSGSQDLVWERLRFQLKHVGDDTRLALSRENVSIPVQNAFLDVWNTQLVATLNVKVKQIVFTGITPDKMVDAVREHVLLMLYRLIRECELLDGDKPLETQSTHNIVAETIYGPISKP